jgi:8-hydroxy-5-deazaflavin:NADPH oxidoreductase
MHVGVLGSGQVGKTLAVGFLKHGHQVMLGTRETIKLMSWIGEHPKVIVGSFADAAKFGEVVVLAVKGSAANEVLNMSTPSNLAGKLVIDTTNPIAETPPVNGVLKFFTGPNESLLERLQRQVPQAHFVKAFNSVGSGLMVNPVLAGGKPTMFICGNDEAARKKATEVLDMFGWEVADMGKAEAARPIEQLCVLWCIPGFLKNDWSHALKVLRNQ